MRTMLKLTRWGGLLALVAVLGCKDLDIENPNEPDANRAFSDPTAIAGLVSGAFKSWFNAHEEYNSALVLSAMSDNYTASWNNWNMRFYTSEGAECPVRCGWDNRPSSAFRFQVETFWYGYYGALSAANDVLTAIRVNDVDLGEDTGMIEAVAVMLQGMVFAQIALNYDQGFIVTEETDISTPAAVAAIPLSSRQELRDEAIAKFTEAIGLAQAGPFTTPAEWSGAVNGEQYTNTQLIKLMRTMQAEVLAFYPRTAAENGQVNWAQVATYAAQGLSSAPAFDFGFFQEAAGTWYSGIKNWGNDITTVRVDTRLAKNVTAGPDAAKVHKDPWPGSPGNPQPDAFDHRVGNGTWGPEEDFLGTGTLAWDGGEGTDFAWASSAIFPAARGQYHQSNLGHIRYSYLAYPGYGLPTEDGTGFVPTYTATLNDLLWAEGLIRGGGSGATAAALINKTRVDRGGLSALTGSEGTPALLAALQYEQDIELISIGSAPFYNRRRIDGLKAMTPRHMPIPAKELQVLQRELYTFGGPGRPDAAPGTDASVGRTKNVRDIWAEISTYSKAQAKRRNRN